MQRINTYLRYACILLAVFIGSCSTDLSHIENDIKELNERVSELESQTSALREAYSNGKVIKSATPITEGDGGWLITFSDNSSIKLVNGEKGEKGEAASFNIVQDLTNGIITITTADNEEFLFNLDVLFPTQAVVLDKKIELSYGGTSNMKIRVNPSSAVLTFEMLSLDQVTTRASYVNEPADYRISSVVPDKNANGEILDGQYIVTLEDNCTVCSYDHTAALVIKSKDSYNNDMLVSSDLFSITERFSLPVVHLSTPGGEPIKSKEVWEPDCTMKIVESDGTVSDYGTINMRGRGNTTWSYPKKPYAIKLNEKREVLGMPKHTRWVLLANWMDRTLMRNAVSLEIGRKTKSLEWTPRGEFVEVIMNGEYVGNYFLCEQIKVDENRVNVTKLKAGDVSEEKISGGYLFELDSYFDEINKFRTERRNLPVMFKEPDEEVVTTEHIEYAKSYFDLVESYLYGTDIPDSKYRDLIDVDTYIDWWFVHELTQNTEPCHPKSSYMYKERDGKLKAGPVWDFDYATFSSKSQDWGIKNAIWYDALFKDPQFVARVKEKWAESKADFESVAGFIDDTAARIRLSNERNVKLWPITNSTVNGDEGMSTDESIARLKTSYLNRLKWISSAIESL